MTQLGVDVFIREETLKDQKIGLLTNMLATTSSLTPTLDALLDNGYRIVKVFVPEHGLWGCAAAGEKVADDFDEARKVPAVSLYGERLKPDSSDFEGLDALVIDLPDIGCRFYTYAWTMTFVLEQALQLRLPTFVLDRPNPIGGIAVEGPCQKQIWGSLVGRFPIPIRHGLTIGELGLWAARFYLKGDASLLQVVPCEGWTRSVWWEETGLPFVPPSPAMPSPTAALAYPGTCLVEGTNLSEGRGTSKPFEWIGSPFADETQMSELLNSLSLPGVRFRPHRFLPTASKHSGCLCRGIQIHILDAKVFQPVRTGLCVLAAFKTLCGQQFAWRETTIDRLWGSDELRREMDAAKDPMATALEWNVEPDSSYCEQRHQVLLYS
ncbi:MAG: DUF1343 domain-containing protein [Armatimonadetes bacterium]|nr:DUF1343 domain-containing protein [Armatimonadota bacterium]MDW8120746.1 DUF1343 domain-containing protein [Armatimonadota bacterium]